MAFSLSTLTAYTEENAQQLVASSVLGAKTAALIKSQGNVMVGVKSAETINIMDTDAFFQSGTSCGFNASGTTSFTQRTVTIGKIKVMEALCPKDLEAYYLQKALPAGSTYDSIVFATEYTNRKTEKIASQIEKALWQGDTGSADGNLNKFHGIIKQVALATSSVVNANSTTYYGTPATSITTTNILDVLDAIYKALPAQIVDKDDVAIFMGTDTFRTYSLKLRASNLYHYAMDQKTDSEFIYPGTAIKVIPVQGLNGTNKLYGMRISNLYLGTDLVNEEEKFELFYAKEADQVRFVAEFKCGVNFAFPDEVVRFEV